MVVRQVTREQLATLKATADALEHGNLDDPVSVHAPPAGPLRTIGLSLGCVLTPLLRCAAWPQDFHAMVDQALSSASSVVGTADVAAKLAREQRLNKLA